MQRLLIVFWIRNHAWVSVSKIVSYRDPGGMLVRYQFDSDNYIQLGYHVGDQRFYVGLKVNGVDKGQKNLVTEW